VREPARAFGCTAFAFEVGAGLVVDGEDHWQCGSLAPTPQATVKEQIATRGVVALLTDAYPGRLEVHEPWHRGREVSWLLRGDVDVDEAQALLDDHGHADLRLVDNGYVGGLRSGGTGVLIDPGPSTLDPSIEAARSFHLTPREASKAAAVARHRQIRGYDCAETISIGDSAEDAGMAAVTGAFWLVAGAIEHDPALAATVPRFANVRRAQGGPGEAVYEAIVTTLMEQRG
jgi:hypothetical protein